MDGRGSLVGIHAVLVASAVALCAVLPESGGDSTIVPRPARNAVVLVADGLRWQEIFGEDTPSPIGGSAAAWQFSRKTAQARRRALMPFLWTTVVRQGQIIGNRTRGSDVRVTNGLNFSYPGYNEMLAGYPDPRITTNNFGPNPNVTVLEWLNQQPAFRDRVAAFTTWSTFEDILNVDRSEMFVRAGSEPPGEALTWDASVAREVEHYVRRERPRVLLVVIGETDDWAHEGRYDLVLATAHQFDRFAGALWTMMERMPEYRDSTALLLTTDHGRGSRPEGWKTHGREVEGAEDVWIALMGPGVPALGERTDGPAITQSQIAATIAALVGENYLQAVPRAAPSFLPQIQH